jgi:hypothetical protein
MKGIAHFITGVALATFFPEVVQSGAQGSLLPMLGGIAGILPDTLDFKFARYLDRIELKSALLWSKTLCVRWVLFLMSPV